MKKKDWIEFIEIPASSGADYDASTTPLIVLFHGFGADANDLQSLSEVLYPQKRARWVFPRGPLEIPLGMGWTGRAWWKIDIQAYERAVSDPQNSRLDISRESPEPLPDLRKKLLDWVEGQGIPWDRVVLGGFSQGAMLATDLFLHAPKNPAGLLVFSGSLINKDKWKPVAACRTGSSVFISHGKSDPVLPYVGSQRLHSFFSETGVRAKLFTFSGGHEISMDALREANEYLRSILENIK